jgi:hypothetical protein
MCGIVGIARAAGPASAGVEDVRRMAAAIAESDETDFLDESVSPLAVFAVLAVLIGLFIAIVQL